MTDPTQIQSQINTLNDQVAAGNAAGYGVGGQYAGQQIPQSILTAATSDQNAPATPTSGSGIPDDTFLGLLNNMNNVGQQNNQLVQQKNLISKALFDQPLSHQELQSLPPDVASIVQSGNQDQMKLQLQVINDSLQGRNQSVAQSIQFLTTGWENAQSRKNTEETNLLNYSKAYGVKPLDIIKAIYPDLLQSISPDQLTALEKLGAPLMTTTQVPNVPTGSTINIPTGTIAYQTNNPLNIKYTPMGGGDDSGISATNGGTFAQFSSPEEGLQMAINLLQSPTYSNLTVDQAMRLWSNNGYGAEVSNVPNVKMSSLTSDQLNQLVTDMATRESGTSVNFAAPQVPTLASGATPEEINKFLTSGAPIRAGTATYSQAALLLAAQFDLLGIPNNILGGMGAAAGRAAMGNKETQLMTAYNLSPVDVGVAKAEFKNLSSANAKLINTAAYNKTYTATATDNLDLALGQSDQVARTGAKFVNNYALWAKGQFTPAGPLATFETYIYTASREYAKVTSGGATSAQGLTDSAQKEASKLLNSAQSPEAFSATVDAMKQDMANVNKEFNNTINSFAPNVASLLGLATGTSTGGGANPTQGTTPSGISYTITP